MSQTIQVIAGLGNPGAEYEQTRHNAGFWLVDALARKHDETWRHQRRFDADVCKISVAGNEIWLIKPMSFMNCSGGPLRAVLDYYRLPIAGTVVAHDELDLPAGALRLKKAGGHGGHNGLRDIISHCGADFYRLRIGIGHPGVSSAVLGHVLKRPSQKEQGLLDEALDKAVRAVPKMIRKGPGIVMNELNRKPKKAKPVIKPVAASGDDNTKTGDAGSQPRDSSDGNGSD
ncbi:MAG: aminoacyl-tRNA hydrolase [Pseudomonadota bacterium]